MSVTPRPKPDNELVTWDCCGNRYELILSRLYPERYEYTPICEGCGQKLLPALLQYYVQLRERLGDKLVYARREYLRYQRPATPVMFGDPFLRRPPTSKE